ncbi:hypothetical protein RHGRI_017333 [Rhododendron griersonianum]|uniref:Uncharacterized protein n=1 Tax=Rhododendron griersonianum TaxID=479676 RepID=A0AAV6JXE2_9ERIC|nr:hypothetical protein RHGRI_017333 [Rhododendron griersonianum]
MRTLAKVSEVLSSVVVIEQLKLLIVLFRFSVDVIYTVVSCSPLITTAGEEQFDSSSDEGFTIGQMHAELCLEGTTEDKRLKSAMRFWPTDEAEAAGSTGSVAAPEAMEVLMVVMDRGGGGEYFEDDEEGRGHQVMTHDEALVSLRQKFVEDFNRTINRVLKPKIGGLKSATTSSRSRLEYGSGRDGSSSDLCCNLLVEPNFRRAKHGSSSLGMGFDS